MLRYKMFAHAKYVFFLVYLTLFVYKSVETPDLFILAVGMVSVIITTPGEKKLFIYNY